MIPILFILLLMFNGFATAKEMIVGPQEMYNSIQSAIDTATTGDTIIVKAGVYNESLIVDKSIHLQSKDGHLKTVIKGFNSSDAIRIIEDQAIITGFSVSGRIYIENANHCHLIDNVIESDQDDTQGIYLFQSLHTVISHCMLRNMNNGIHLDLSHNNVLWGNVISFCNSGILLSESNQSLIYGNTFVTNTIAMDSYHSSRNAFVANFVYHNDIGLQLYASDNAIIAQNSIDENETAVYAKNADNNITFLNNFIQNTVNVHSIESSNYWNSLCGLNMKYGQFLNKVKLGNYYSNNNTISDPDMNGVSGNAFNLDVNEPNDLFPLILTTDHYLIQTWQLNQDHMMYWNVKDLQPGKISLSENEEKIYFVAPEYPEISFTGVDSWEGQLVFTSPPATGYTLLLEIGYVTNNFDFVPKGPTSVITGDDSQYIYPFTCVKSAFTVPDGYKPAMQITKYKNWGYDILTGGLWSFISPPEGDYFSLYPDKHPEIVSVYPYLGETGISTAAPILINFSEIMDAESLTHTTIQLVGDENQVIPMEIFSAGTTVKMMPNHALSAFSNYTVTLFQQIKDSFGYPLAETFQTYFRTGSGPDTEPPVIVGTTPCHQCLNENTAILVKIVFSEPMQSSSINLSTVKVSDGIENITGAISYDGLTATFLPQSPLKHHTQYQVIVTASVMDIAGNSLVNPYSFVFTTTENVIYVGPSENYTDIQTAINGSSDNTRIIVRDGEYRENIVINKSLTLKSVNGYTHTTIIAKDSGQSVIEIQESNVTVQGFSLYGATQFPASGIFVNSTASACQILNNRCGIANDQANAFGIYLNSTEKNGLFNNQCAFNSENGIHVDTSHENTLVSNQCMFNAKTGIHLEGSQNNLLLYNQSSNNNSGILLKMQSCRNNALYLNSFKENSVNSALSDNQSNQWYSPTFIQYTYDHKTLNSSMGNYYSDFSGTDTENDGIIDQKNNPIGDLYPLANDTKQYLLNIWWFQNSSVLTSNILDLSFNQAMIEGYAAQIFKENMPVTSEKTYTWGDVFNGQLTFAQAPGSDDHFLLEIGYCDENNTFYPMGPDAELTGDNITTTHIFNTGMSSFTIPKNNTFAAQITNKSAWDHELITGNGLSYISLGEASISYFTLNISISPLDTGAVSADGILCPGDCTESYTANATIQLTTAPKSSYIFDHWEGDIESTDSELDILMNGEKNLIAVFKEKPPAPEVIGPENESIFYQRPVTLKVDDTIAYTKHFMVKQCGKPYQLSEYPKSFYAETSSSAYTLPVTDFQDGLKYIWKSGYTDATSGKMIWSVESSFKVGTVSASKPIQLAPGITREKFRLISIPYWPEQPEAETQFSQSIVGSYESNYKIATYDPEISAYVEYGNDLKIEPGRSYWFLARDGMSLQIQGITVTTASDIDIELWYQPATGDGWNMIGCPNHADYYWGELQVIEYDNNGSIISGPFNISDTTSDVDDLIDRHLWYWEDSQYKSPSDDSSLPDYDFVMHPNTGYWVHVNRPNVVLRFPKMTKKRSLKRNHNKRFKTNSISAEPPPCPIDDLTRYKENSSQGIESKCFIQTICFPISLIK